MQQELTQGYTKNLFLKTEIDSFIDKGNLNTMYQRMDMFILHGTEEYPNRFCIKIGKTIEKRGEFINKEEAQEFRTAYSIQIDRMINDLLKAKLFMMKLEKKLTPNNFQYHLDQEHKRIEDIYRGRI